MKLCTFNVCRNSCISVILVSKYILIITHLQSYLNHSPKGTHLPRVFIEFDLDIQDMQVQVYIVHIFEQNRITVIEYIIEIKLHFILLVFSVALNFSIYIILSGTEPLSLSTLVAEMDLFEYFLYWNIIFNSLFPYFSSSVSGNLFHNASKLNECLWAFFCKVLILRMVFRLGTICTQCFEF